MFPPARRILLLAGLAWALAVGCSDVNVPVGDPDGGGGGADGVGEDASGQGGCTTESDCDDGIPCTEDRCLGDGTCENVLKDGVCLIGGSCHDEGAFPEEQPCRVCKPNVNPESWSADQGASCDDGDACTKGDACTADGVCEGEPKDCDDELACTEDACDPETGECTHEPKSDRCVIDGSCYEAGAQQTGNPCMACLPEVDAEDWSPNDGASCDDGDPCSQDDHCEGGSCVGTCECETAADCTGEAAPCKRMDCQNFECVEVVDPERDGEPCDDGNACTVGDVCSSGTCESGDVKSCSGQVETGTCEEASCDPATGDCVATQKDDGASCDDGDPCTVQDACQGGTCEGQPMDCSGEADACNEGLCVEGSCVAEPTVGASCDDGEACTVDDACNEQGVCTGTWNADLEGCGCGSDAECEGQFADQPCKVGQCNEETGECEAATVSEGTACDDGNACTQEDVCTADGICTGDSYTCSDDLACTQDSCDGEGGCEHTVQEGSCLIDGTCYNAGEASPDEPCLVCDPGASVESWTADEGASCDDGDPCTQNDTCDASGTCSGEAYACDLLEQCQTGSCDGEGGCEVTTLESWCVIDGTCVASGTTKEGEPCMACDPDQSQTAWSPRSGSCDDGQPCTKNDVCNDGSCSGDTYDCDDGLGCTADACNEGGPGCSHQIQSGSCAIDGSCYDAGAEKPGNPCLVCDPEAAASSWSPAGQGKACDDGLACTEGDQCNGEGVCSGSAECATLACQTATCTGDGCATETDDGWCAIDGSCWQEGQTAPDTPCLVCDPATSQSEWSQGSGSCDDGQPCTQDDACQQGECVGDSYSCDDGLSCTVDTCHEGEPGCSHQLEDGFCLIDGACYEAMAQNPDNPCQACRPEANAESWTNRENGASCPDDGKSCTTDTCDGQGQCLHRASSSTGECLIDGSCWDDQQKNPNNACELCRAKSSPEQWEPLGEEGASCGDDGNSCTRDECDGQGTCVHPTRPDFVSCDDGDDETSGDWCFGGTCSGFVLETYDGEAQQADRFIEASSAGAGGIHAIRRLPESLRGELFPEKPVPEPLRVEGLPSPPVGGLSRWSMVIGSQLFDWSDGSWSADTSRVEAWHSVEKNADATFQGVERAVGGNLLGARFHTLGRGSEGQGVIRTCSEEFCLEPCTTSWSCQDDQLSSTVAQDRLVEMTYLAPPDGITRPYVGADLDNDSDDGKEFIDILRFDQKPESEDDDPIQWELMACEGEGGCFIDADETDWVLRAFETAGSYAVAAGDAGFLATFRVSSDGDGNLLGHLTRVDPTWFDQPSNVDFVDVFVAEGHVFVLAEQVLLGTTWFLLHAPLDAELPKPEAWSKHQVAHKSGGLGIPGEEPPPCDDAEAGLPLHEMHAAGSSSSLFYVLGGWCESSGSVYRQDAAVLYWPMPQ